MMDKSALVKALCSYLPEQSVLHETEDLRPYECDGLPAYRQMPLLAVLPETVKQL